MSYIAVINRSAADARDVAFWAEAWNLQAREISDVWGVEYSPVVVYSSADGLPGDARVLTIRDSIDAPGALGYHDDASGAIFAEIKFTGPDTSVTGSHEVLEETVDPLCNRWAPFDAEHEQAVEVCDRVESDSYDKIVTVLGETRSVKVSNYLLPRAFGEADSGAFDEMGLVSAQMQIRPGGYVIVRDITTGKVGNVFARGAGPRVIPGAAAGAVLAEKLAKRRSRLLRRLRAG